MQQDIKLVIFDLNATVISHDTWPKFQQLMGMTAEEDLTLWKLNSEGILPDKLWLQVVNNLYRTRGTHTYEEIQKTVLQYEYLPGAKEAVKAMQQKYAVGIISGAPDILVEHVAKELDIDLFGSNALLLFDEQGNFQELITLHEEATSKVVYLQEFCRRLDIRPEQVARIGDGDNDIELFRRTKHGITFTGSKIASKAWRTIDTIADLPSVL